MTYTYFDSKKESTMNLPTPETIKHPHMMDEYVLMQANFIHRQTGMPIEEAIPKIQKIIQEKYTPKKLIMLQSPSYGNVKKIEQDLWKFIRFTADYILSPSGSVYKPPYQTRSVISQMLVEKLAERKKVKKVQLKAEGAGDDVLAKRCWYKQATIKINCNSLPGGFGSEYNIFYDKPNYNTITSAARCMISRAYTICEQLLGGNFSWFSEEELINHIILNLREMSPKENIRKCIDKYKIQIPTRQMLMTFYTDTLKQYVPSPNMKQIRILVDSLDELELTFLYYYCNLRHLIWGNDNIFRPYIKHLFDVSDIAIDENVTKDDAYAIDDTVTTLTTVAFSDKLGNFGLGDICSDHPEYIPKLVAYSRATERRLRVLDLLMDTFVNTGADVPESQKKPHTWRNTTIVSDTDSVIFTADAWDSWWRDGKLNIVNESYQIASLVSYWLHHAVKFALKRFSIKFGITGKDTSVLAMKNEFLYPVMLIFDTKKTYVGIQKVKEGVILPKPKADVKGQTLRGSSICNESLNFSENLMIHDILEPVMNGPLSGEDIIQKIVEFEHEIRDSIEQRKEMTYLKITSLKYERDYKNPESASVVIGHQFWQEIFAEKYGDIHAPTKVKTFEVIHPKEDYWKWLEKVSPDICEKMQRYVSRTKKFPNHLIVNPIGDTMPMEMIPLVNIRAVIWHNIKPSYNTLKRLNISVGCEDKKLLLSDIYG